MEYVPHVIYEAACPQCGKIVRVYRDGLLRRYNTHNHLVFGVGQRRCNGSDKAVSTEVREHTLSLVEP